MSPRDQPADDSARPLRRELRPAGPPRLHFSARAAADEVIVEVEGELDILTAPRLASQLGTVIRSSADDVVLDLRGVEFLDSAGLQILMNARRRLDRSSRNLSVICDPGPVRRVIELARLVETLGVVSGAEAGAADPPA